MASTFPSITEGLNTDGVGTAILTITAAFAQLERGTMPAAPGEGHPGQRLAKMIERTRAGLAAAATNGRKGRTSAQGRRHRCRQSMLGVSRATVYRYLAKDASLSV